MLKIYIVNEILFARFARSSSIASTLLDLLARRALRALCSHVKSCEHTNVQFKRYLRWYFLYWYAITRLVTFAYNNAINVFTSMILFETNQNYHFRMFFENNQNLKVKSKFAKNNVKHLQKLLNVFRVNLIDAQVKQAKYQDKRTLFKKYFVRQYVMLNEKNIRIKRNKKLKWKHFELFRVLEIIEDQVYRLELLKRWRIHDVFHVSFLKKSKFKKRKNTTIEFTYQSKDIEIEKDEIIEKLYEIEIILNNHIYVANKCFDRSYNESKLYYKIQWKNYEKQTWKSISCIKHLRDMLREFHIKNFIKSNVNKAKNHKKTRRVDEILMQKIKLTRK